MVVALVLIGAYGRRRSNSVRAPALYSSSLHFRLGGWVNSDKGFYLSKLRSRQRLGEPVYVTVAANEQSHSLMLVSPRRP
jgi:hypothetical protein